MLLNTLGRVDRRLLIAKGFASYTVPTSTGAVHVLDGQGSGSLPPIVVLHGICSRATNYRAVLPRLLAASKRVIAPDMPAHGFSDAPGDVSADAMLQGTLDALNAVIDEPVVLFGNSMGGAGAVRFTAQSPEKVRALILNSPGGAQATQQDLEAFLESFRMRTNADAAKFVGQIFLKPPWFRHLVAPGVRKMFRADVIQRFLDTLTVDDLVTAEELHKLVMPTLLLWGRGDRLMPMEHYRWYASNLPDHAVVEDPPDFGHCPYQDRPVQLADRIIAFAAEHQ